METNAWQEANHIIRLKLLALDIHLFYYTLSHLPCCIRHFRDMMYISFHTRKDLLVINSHYSFSYTQHNIYLSTCFSVKEKGNLDFTCIFKWCNTISPSLSICEREEKISQRNKLSHVMTSIHITTSKGIIKIWL